MLKFGRIDVEERMDGCGCGDVLLYLGGVEGVIILLFFSLNSSLLDLIVFFFFAFNVMLKDLAGWLGAGGVGMMGRVGVIGMVCAVCMVCVACLCGGCGGLNVSDDAQWISPMPQVLRVGDDVVGRVDVPEIADVTVLPDGCKVFSGLMGDAAMAAWADSVPLKVEAYYLKYDGDRAVVVGSDERGLFYGLKSLEQVVKGRKGRKVEIVDWPVIAERGVVEGFYGNPWSFDDRVSQLRFYGDNKMNVYIYGPKDDPWHNARWFEPYPEGKADELRRLVEEADRNYVKFVWAMHPGNAIESDADRRMALEKFEQMYGLGVRSFAIFFDDISDESVDSQISYMNFLTDEFVRRHDDVEPLTVCPTQYSRLFAKGDYLPEMGKGLYPEIRVMWTGNAVIDMVDGKGCEWFTGQTGRKPFIWLNYPVNDYGDHHLLMGDVREIGIGASDRVSGFVANPMQYAEASKVALQSVADWCWNPAAYDAARSWVYALKCVAPGHEDAFRIFCENNVDIGENNVGELRRPDESPEFRRLQERWPELNVESADAYRAFFKAMKASAEELLANDDQKALTAEIREFLHYFDCQAARGLLAVDIVEAEAAGNGAKAADAKNRYDELTAEGEGLVSRGFDGSLQPVKPRTATLYIEPFIRKAVAGAQCD